MRTSVVVAVAGVLIVAAGGAWFGLEVYLQQRFRAGLDQALATLPPGTTATYKTAHYSLLSHRAVVTEMTLHGELPGDPPRPFDVAADSVETRDPNLDFPASWANAVAAPTSLGPDTALTVAGSVAVKGLTVHSAVINLTEASVQITKLRVYPWALLHDGMPTWRELQASMAARSRPSELADLRPIFRAEAAAMLGVAYDSYAAGAAKVTETLPGFGIEYAIRETTGGAFDRGVLRGAAGAGIALNGDVVGDLSIDRVAMGPIDARAPMTRLINGEALSPALLDGIRIGRIAYEGITVRPPGQPAIHIGGLSLGPVAFAQGMPVAGEFGWTDVSVSRSRLPDPRARDLFDKLGLDTITMSFALAYDRDLAARRGSIRDTTLKVNELGTITLSAELTNLAMDLASIGQAALAHARLRFEDASLTDRLLRAGAAQTGTDPAAFRQQIMGLVRRQSMAGGGGASVLEAAGAFLAAPHSLTIEFSPPAPVPLVALLGALANPARSAAMPGLTVTANQ